MSTVSRAGPLFVVPLSSFCAWYAVRSRPRHGLLKPQLCLDSAAVAHGSRGLCSSPGSSCSASGFNHALETPRNRRRKGSLRWKDQRNWTRTYAVRNLGWDADQSPYETLGVERDADENTIKGAYRRMAKQFHPDVYNQRSGELKKGETPESYFIQIQAAYELLMDRDQRRQYDIDHRTNPLKASSAWMDWVIKKRKSFEQRGEMAASAWAEQQMRELNLKARRAARDKVDPEEERRILAREKAASVANFENTIRRQALVLKKRDIMNRKAREEAQKKLVQQLLEAEGLELDDEHS